MKNILSNNNIPRHPRQSTETTPHTPLDQDNFEVKSPKILPPATNNVRRVYNELVKPRVSRGRVQVPPKTFVRNGSFA